MLGTVGGLRRDEAGAVAPTVALSLLALLAAGGIAFDYARMASLDTELQQAADQAALAGATQLNGETGACARAAAAASTMLSNRTLMANDGNASGNAVTVDNESGCDATGKIRFYQDVGKTNAATTDANAKFVEVEVNPRQANFALTPVVAAFNSGQLKAIAFAGLDSAICKVPPLMMCNPKESTDPTFTIEDYIGHGIRLIANDGGGTYGPGNFGFLDTGAGNGAQTLRQLLGASNVPGDCTKGDGVTTETGSIISVRAALNTRFGIYDNGSLNNACGNDGAGCPPSANIRKDLVLVGNGNALAQLGVITGGGGNGWREATQPYPWGTSGTLRGAAYRNLTDAEILLNAPMGYPQDKCHAFGPTNEGSCPGGQIGDGDWDRYAYFRTNSANYGSLTNATAVDTFMTTNFATTTPTRYQVYEYEMRNASTRLQTQTTGGGLKSVSNPTLLTGEPAPVYPSSTMVDRRLLTVAVINCTAQGVSGHTTNVAVTKWIDIFLVQPAVRRTTSMLTENGDVYVEVKGVTQNATDEGAVQLVKKSVPYLIE